ncbi:hypothetical protein ACTID9_12890 [Brevibacillus fluminis]|uniref:hypothetical protein n=1 Tax=Brevibacillus fluminis TaxID=511487 RepID=UPI003F8CF25F
MNDTEATHEQAAMQPLPSDFFHTNTPVFTREGQGRRDYDQIAKINEKLADSKRYQIPLTVRYVKPSADDHGAVLAVHGVVGAFDPMRHEVRIHQKNGKWTWLFLGRIVAVE